MAEYIYPQKEMGINEFLTFVGGLQNHLSSRLHQDIFHSWKVEDQRLDPIRFTHFGYNLLNITAGGLHIIIIKLILWLELVI